MLSGSSAAEARLSRIAPEAAGEIHHVVREAFVYGFDGVMILCLIVSIVGALGALLVSETASQSDRGDEGEPENPRQ
ncbi:hypothetical protein [Natronorubrum halophilum]|uniref:hypothetical protein n=1 Tax=Natronorubrum halophilum TaxID=1702106 RepID=UPI0010C188F1|nr:hypothetical protein [Natronorubrum halophilum]